MGKTFPLWCRQWSRSPQWHSTTPESLWTLSHGPDAPELPSWTLPRASRSLCRSSSEVAAAAAVGPYLETFTTGGLYFANWRGLISHFHCTDMLHLNFTTFYTATHLLTQFGTLPRMWPLRIAPWNIAEWVQNIRITKKFMITYSSVCVSSDMLWNDVRAWLLQQKL